MAGCGIRCIVKSKEGSYSQVECGYNSSSFPRIRARLSADTESPADGRSEGQGRECQYDQKHITATVGDLAAFFFESEHLFPRASSCKLSV
ncbi:hypothetical protein LZ554_009571 [Drepanopeziza brunnea f. sp. 'monogermtubi']|nr:hypothetical protein LZ554_009571 [Drepanopeziza brunnea f. sp. 'monogermtubi']